MALVFCMRSHVTNDHIIFLLVSCPLVRDVLSETCGRFPRCYPWLSMVYWKQFAGVEEIYAIHVKIHAVLFGTKDRRVK